MLDLLRSYRETKRQSVKRKKYLEGKRCGLEEEIESLKSKGRSEKLENVKREVFKISHDIDIMNAAISDTTFVISWIATGKMPDASRGIGRQSTHKREIAFEDKWIDAFVDNGMQLHELPGPDKETEEMKVELVKDLKKCLSARQLEIFVMLAEGLEQSEIASMLGVSKQAVSEVVIRGRREIKDAGWVFA